MRIYEGKYISTTSLLSLKNPFNRESFEKWCEKVGKDPELVLKTSQILGEKVSNLIENQTKGLEWITEPPLDRVEECLYKAVSDFLKEWKVLNCEEVVYCDQLHYAGRYDGIISGKKGIYLADWKTFGAWNDKPYKRDSSKIRKARQQLSLYANAMGWKEKLCVIIFKNDGTWELEDVKYDKSIVEWVKDNQELILETINLSKKNNG